MIAAPNLKSQEIGSAAVEFTFIAIGLLMPFFWVVTTLVSIHSAALAVEDVAKQAARAFSLAPDPGRAHLAADSIASEVLGGHGLSQEATSWQLVCAPSCLHPGGTVTAEVRGEVGLAWVPSSWGLPGAIAVNAVHVERIDFYRDTP